MNQEKQILEKYESMNKKLHKKTCKIRGAVYPEVEEALILWMKQMRSNKIPLFQKLNKSIFNRKILGWIQLLFKKLSKFLITKWENETKKFCFSLTIDKSYNGQRT